MRTKRKLREKMRALWGVTRTRALDADEMRDVAYYFREYRKNDAGGIVDETTWADLDMDLVFQSMNHAQSSAGAEVLYDMLHCVDESNDALERRGRAMRQVTENERARLDIQLACAKIGDERFHGAHTLLFHPEVMRARYFFLYIILALIPVAIIICGLFDARVFLALFPAFIVNLMFYYLTWKRWMRDVASVRHLIAVLGAAKALSKCSGDAFPDAAGELKALCAQLKPVMRASAIYAVEGLGDLGILLDYIRILFQLDMLAYTRLSRLFKEHNPAIRRAYHLVGEIDACVSVASWRCAQEVCSQPTWNADGGIIAKGIAHPLVRKPVRNDMAWDQCALITGSNASGKSTFIKAMAINAILAQSVYSCLAEEFVMPRARVYSSMALRDNVQQGESYFIVEIKSLSRMLRALGGETRLLCFIDEILRGTNTIERIAASTALLRYLSRKNALCMAASHDLELTRLLPMYKQYHFREELTDSGMTFSYKLLNGPSDTRNAIELLKVMEFPDEVVSAALELCES